MNLPSSELKVGDVIRASALGLPSREFITLSTPQYIVREPGLYTINPESPNASVLAVNHDYTDSEPTKGKITGKVKYFSSDFSSEIFMSRMGRDLWKWLLAIVLILVLAEIIIVKLAESKPQMRS
ncbi:MAG: hypothetical protein LRZ88_13040 [Candidatus Cloacimonetes bacterium]|nr:hypothetical protein [Candidatus Cloacimonadota bacterium]